MSGRMSESICSCPMSLWLHKPEASWQSILTRSASALAPTTSTTYHLDGAHLDNAFVIDHRPEGVGRLLLGARPRSVAGPPLGVRARALLLGLSPPPMSCTDAGRRAGGSRQEARL